MQENSEGGQWGGGGGVPSGVNLEGQGSQKNLLGNVGLAWPLEEGRNEGESGRSCLGRDEQGGAGMLYGVERQALSLTACLWTTVPSKMSLTWKDSMQET